MNEPGLYTATYCGVEKNVPVVVINGWIIRLDTGVTHFEDNFTDLQPAKAVNVDAVVVEKMMMSRWLDALIQIKQRFLPSWQGELERLLAEFKSLALSSPPVKEPEIVCDCGICDNLHPDTCFVFPSPEPSKGVEPAYVFGSQGAPVETISLVTNLADLHWFFTEVAFAMKEDKGTHNWKLRDYAKDLKSQIRPITPPLEPKPLTEEQFNLGDTVIATRRHFGRAKWTLRLVNGERKWVYIYPSGTMLAIADWSDLIEPTRVEDGA